MEVAMLKVEIETLGKPQWIGILKILKERGAMVVSELAAAHSCSYMAMKGHCEELVQMGYLNRTRVSREGVGRPEIYYSVTEKVEGACRDHYEEWMIGMFEDMKKVYGEAAPDRLVYLYFERERVRLSEMLAGMEGLRAKVQRLIREREKRGHGVRMQGEKGVGCVMEEWHHPLGLVFRECPRASLMEVRMLEEVLGTRVRRWEESNGRGSVPRVFYEFEGLKINE